MTPSNDNGRCPETGCTHPAGTACTAWMCPGRSLKVSRASLPAQAGADLTLSSPVGPTPVLSLTPFHAHPSTCGNLQDHV